MPQNERLRVALLNSGKSVSDLAEAAGVDPKTFERWITKGRTPHRVNAVRAAQALNEDVSYLWPDIERGCRQPGSHPDLIALTVVFTPGEGQLSIGLGGHEWVDAAVSGAIGLVAVPPVLLGTAYGIWKENQLDKEVWQVIDERTSAPAEAGP